MDRESYNRGQPWTRALLKRLVVAWTRRELANLEEELQVAGFAPTGRHNHQRRLKRLRRRLKQWESS